MFQPIPKPDYTPWGHADHAEQIFAGVWSLMTPRHGGLYVSEERRKASPFLQEWMLYTFGRKGYEGWFEEDCDWCLVALAFPDEWKAWQGNNGEASLAGAKGTFDHWIASKAA